MARNFNGGNQFLASSALPVTATPLTMSAWFRPLGLPGSNTIQSIDDGQAGINCWWMTTQIIQYGIYTTAPASCDWNGIGVALIPSGVISYAGGVAGGYTNAVSSKAINFNNNPNTYVLLFVTGDSTNDYVYAANFAGSPMTLIAKSPPYGGSSWTYLFGMANAPGGIQLVQAFATTTCNVIGFTISTYNNVSGYDIFSVTANRGAGVQAPTLSIIPSYDNTWAISFFRNSYGAINNPPMGITRLYEQADGVASCIDSNAVITSSSFYAYIGNGSVDTGSVAGPLQIAKWNHGLAVFTSAVSRQAFLNGIAGTLSTVNVVPTGSLLYSVAAFALNGAGGRYFYGDIAELAVWNAALTADEALSLSQGHSPLLIRPQNLMSYAPLEGIYAPEPDRFTRVSLGLSGNAPTIADHPPIRRPRNRQVYWPPLLIRTALSPVVAKVTMGNVAPMGRAALQSIVCKVTLSSTIEPKVTVQKLIACIAPESWDNHFVSRTWMSPQNQVTAGYPRYCQPTALTGMYEEIVDFGGTFANVIVNLNWTFNTIAGNVSIAPFIAVSSDGTTFTPLVGGSSQFAQSIRYVKVHFDFASVDDKSLAEFFNLQVLLDVKNELDGGEGDAIATDLNGTIVNFNKTFKNVKSITVSAKSAVDVSAAYDFTSTPNPTGFKVFLFNASGARVNGHFSWKARGVI